MKPGWKGVYLVTDRAMIPSGTLDDVIMGAARAGVTMIQLREKTGSTRFLIDEAVRIRSLLVPFHIPLIINDRVDVAYAAGAEGVHLGQSDMPVAVARELLGENAIIGLSVETIAQVEAAESMPIDYLGISGVFATSTKPDLHDHWGIDGIRRVRARSRYPLVAIGGIDVGNALAIIAAGADMIAVVSAICAQPDPETAARRLVQKVVDNTR